MQLGPRGAGIALLACLAAGVPARAEDAVSLGTSLFHESGGPLRMTVLMPAARASVDFGEPVTVGVAWTADVVSGASVAIVDAAASKVDAISQATLADTRHALSGRFTLRDGASSATVGYTRAFENDYRSHALSMSARSELADRNTVLEVSYARSFDETCDIAGSFEPVMKPRLDTSDGCFTSEPARAARDLAIHGFSGAFTQTLTPVLNLQATLDAQILHGFQANPYRAVVIGRAAAQEHHPGDRARYALGLGLRLWLKPLRGALQPQARLYRDTWDISSITAELGYEQSTAIGLRLRLRGRYYAQTRAAFYSDDYVLAPRGQYFTGDRELSSMSSLLGGAQLVWPAPSAADGSVMGFLSAFDVTLKGDLLKTRFRDFHYDAAPVPNTLALIGSIEVHAAF